MIKSLYIRIVLMFLSAIIVSLLASSIIAGELFKKSTHEQTQDFLVSMGHSLVRIFERSGFDNRGAVMDDMSNFPVIVGVQIYDESSRVEKYGLDINIPVSEEEVEKVRQGQTVRGSADGHIYVGINFNYQNQTYAMFIRPVLNKNIGNPVSGIISTMVLIVMIGGSLFFIVEAAFLVHPLRKLTEATRRMSKGDFNVDLKVKRKDEIGVLVQSFDEMRQQLHKIEQMRQDFVSNVSHEIQSPLTSIHGFALALKDETLVSNDRERYLDIIITESERVSRMSDNLLKLASLDSDHHPFHPETFRLDEQIKQTVVAFEPQWSAKGIAIHLDLPVVKITGDRDGLNQVWINLLSNSIKFTPQKGGITITLQQDINRVEITFADTGIGIAEEDQNHIFERFYKADRSRNRIYGGNGLGLAIVGKIVGLHHGEIKVRSKLGSGTEIVVILPYYDFNFK
ncbi:HAMP domain-containing sensor histidine kinase [Paenibacillus sp. M1]|uniref:Heme sensor protein HssS n=1 Tax=Paenibacillus haidiansis TaxID=1574488 RepID=A0ABU7VZS4_9BACL